MPEQYVPQFGEFLSRLVMSNFDEGYIRKKRFGNEYFVPASAPMVVGALVFQTGALVGHARPDRSDALASLLYLTRKNADVPYENALRALIVEWVKKSTRTPQRLHEMWNLAQFPDVDLSDFETLGKLNKDEIRVNALTSQANWAAVYGVAFGMFHGAFERLWEISFETAVDPAEWEEMRAAGLDIPERQELYPMARATTDALNQTAAYVREHRPDLLDPLDLADYGKG